MARSSMSPSKAVYDCLAKHGIFSKVFDTPKGFLNPFELQKYCDYFATRYNDASLYDIFSDHLFTDGYYASEKLIAVKEVLKVTFRLKPSGFTHSGPWLTLAEIETLERMLKDEPTPNP